MQILQDIGDFVLETCENVTNNWTDFDDTTVDRIVDILTDKLYSLIRGLTSQITGFINSAFDYVNEIAEWLDSTIETIVQMIEKPINDAVDFIQGIADGINDTINKILDPVIDGIDAVINGVTTVTEAIK